MINHPSDIPGSDPPSREPSALESVDAMLFESLQRPMPTPDLTRNIMGRLGYMKAVPPRRRFPRRSARSFNVSRIA
jgi:hypothetical protein